MAIAADAAKLSAKPGFLAPLHLEFGNAVPRHTVVTRPLSFLVHRPLLHRV